jgi:hypothetical protein
MSARYEFKVGPANRHSGYADPVTVIADSFSQSEAKAIAFSGFSPRNGKAWLIRIEEVPPPAEVAQP